jgi:hypothetical protein
VADQFDRGKRVAPQKISGDRSLRDCLEWVKSLTGETARILG